MTEPSVKVTTYTYNTDNTLLSLSSAGSSNNFEYDLGLTTRMSHSGANFVTTYFGDGRKKKITASGTTLANYAYTDSAHSSTTVVTYPTGEKRSAYYNALENPVKSTYTQGGTETTLSEIKYDGNGKVTEVIDNVKNVKHTYTYDTRGNVTKETKYTKNGTVWTEASNITYTYDTDYPDRVTSYTYSDTSRTYTPEYKTYEVSDSEGINHTLPSRDDEITELEISGFGSQSITTDGLGRVTNKSVSTYHNLTVDSDEYEYVSNNLMPDIIYKAPHGSEDRHRQQYIYDNAKQNVVKYREYTSVENDNPDSPDIDYDDVLEEEHEYTYDSLNRITCEICGDTKTEFTYDAAGNITSKSVSKIDESTGDYVLDKQYDFVYNTSGWKDQLLRIDVSGNVPCDNENGYCWCTNSENFSYNNIGNPTYYRNKSLTWSKVNQLTYFDGNTFTYDAAGIRTSKNNITYEYHGDQLHKETRGSTTIEYIYGIDGVIGFIYGETPYYYIKNLFGDVIKIANNQNVIVAEYLYDAWGNHTITYDPSGIGSLNPIRYRSYYYDTETGLYYLKTRYYDPEIGRFISPDSTKYLDPESIHGLNLYAYCFNNPVMNVDPNGHFPIFAALFIGTIITSALIGGGIAAYSSIKNGDKWYEVALKTVSGAALGGMLGAATGIGAALATGGTIAGLSVGASVAVGLGVSIVGSALLGATNSFVNQIIDNDWDIHKVNVGRIGSDALVAGIKGLLSFGSGAWTGGAGLWNIPKGAAPGALNFTTKILLNTVIGNGWKLTVDAIYASILEEECGWINGLTAVTEWLF